MTSTGGCRGMDGTERGETVEAQAAMKEALRLGTRDANLFITMIARAVGDRLRPATSSTHTG